MLLTDLYQDIVDLPQHTRERTIEKDELPPGWTDPDRYLAQMYDSNYMGELLCFSLGMSLYNVYKINVLLFFNGHTIFVFN